MDWINRLLGRAPVPANVPKPADWPPPPPVSLPAMPGAPSAAVAEQPTKETTMEELLAILGEVNQAASVIGPLMLMFHNIAQGIQAVNPTAPGPQKLNTAVNLVSAFVPKVAAVLGDQTLRTAISGVVDLSKMPGGPLEKITAAATVAGNIATAITSVKQDLQPASGDSPQG